MIRGRVLLMYAPYLPLRERLTVKGWVLVPAVALDEADAVSPCTALAAGGLARLYESVATTAPVGPHASGGVRRSRSMGE
jgi:hypothetical protein